MKEALNINQTQQLTQRLSPRQVQYMRLLEMSSLELEEEVRRQLDDNPALEAVSPIEDETAPTFEDLTTEVDKEDDPADYWMPTGSADISTYQVAAEGPDLIASLNQQLNELSLDNVTRKIAQYIIGNIDENGYLTRSLDAMANDIMIGTGLDITDEDMQAAFDIVRDLEPAGVGAVDLRDCLLLQLKRISPTTLPQKTAIEIVTNYFDLFSKKHFDRLQTQLGLNSPDLLREAIKTISSLNPKPGSGLEPSSAMLRMSQITPDVAVEETDDGRFTVSLVSGLPQLQIESTFAVDMPIESMRSKGVKEAQAFIKLKRDDAEALIAALKMRGNTLLAVTEAIVKRQPEFFHTGDTAVLRPMILKDISSDTGIELSAVSRATAGKYVATQMGIYPLKIFFNEAPHDDDDTSSHKLMDELQKIVNGEDPHHPLSDLALQEEMEKRGYKLARRTITKYREKMGLPVGRLRKKL